MLCIKCNAKIPALGIFCPQCGVKQEIKQINHEQYEEDESKFAFHSEYYGGYRYNFDEYSNNNFMGKYDDRWACYKNTIYKNGSEKNTILKIVGKDKGSFIQVLENIDNKHFSVNNRGIFSKNDEDKLVLISQSGDTIEVIDLHKELYDISSYYIYDSKVYVLYRNFTPNWENVDFFIEEYDIFTKNVREIWKFKNIKADVEEFIQNKVAVQQTKDDVPEQKIIFKYLAIGLSKVYANSKNIIFGFHVYADDDEKYGGNVEQILHIDVKTLESEFLNTDADNKKYQIMSFDMLHNCMWYKKKNEKDLFYKAPITPFREISSDNNGVWRCSDKNREVGEKSYFDGVHFYTGESYMQFYSFDKNGQCAEWNQSGHGGANIFSVVGEWIYAGLDNANYYFQNEDNYLFPHSLKRPMEKDWLDLKNVKIEADETKEWKAEMEDTSVLEKVETVVEPKTVAESVLLVSEIPKEGYVLGEKVSGNTVAERYSDTIRIILSKYPDMMYEFDALFTTDVERAARYSSKREIIVSGITVIINTGNNTTVKKKNIQRICKKLNIASEIVWF